MATLQKPRGQQGATLPRVRAISRAVAILRAFSADKPHLALNEIVRATGLDAGTTRRILVTLRDEGLVHQNPANGLYSASTGLIDLARAVPESLTLTSLVEQQLIDLAEATQTTVYLSLVRDDAALCTARHNGGQAIEVRWWAVGETRPFNRGTGPRVLLAYLDASERDRILARRLKLDPGEESALKQELEQTRKRGFIVMHDEIAVGISAMAVPLLDDQGRLLAAISTGGLTPRYVGAAQAAMLEHMQDAAGRMQVTLRGYSH
ncbi:IclR family transcriptional regulator [Lutimaribacter marinistellae]|uniref:IclR family transcriptional regulator n=1 Tax=Lutimaribacter marinistellae TaxID=1820329 RepID=A0ABV7TAC6_9RHOB